MDTCFADPLTSLLICPIYLGLPPTEQGYCKEVFPKICCGPTSTTAVRSIQWKNTIFGCYSKSHSLFNPTCFQKPPNWGLHALCTMCTRRLAYVALGLLPPTPHFLCLLTPPLPPPTTASSRQLIICFLRLKICPTAQIVATETMNCFCKGLPKHLLYKSYGIHDTHADFQHPLTLLLFLMLINRALCWPVLN